MSVSWGGKEREEVLNTAAVLKNDIFIRSAVHSQESKSRFQKWR